MSQATQVLEFGLGAESYCLDIAYIDEIVDAGELTRIPNSPPHVEGVMDLRGRTTSIIDPKTVFGIDDDDDGDRSRIIVFDPETTGDKGAIGWVVDEVYQVVQVTDDDIDDTTLADEESIRGIVKREDRFVVWVEPDVRTAEPEAPA